MRRLFRRLRQWFLSWLSSAQHAHLTLLNEKVERLSAAAAKSEAQLRRTESDLTEMSERFRLSYEQALQELRESRKLITSLTEALDGAREQLNTAEKLTIPALVVSHDLLVKRNQADMAVQAMRIVGSGGMRAEE